VAEPRTFHGCSTDVVITRRATHLKAFAAAGLVLAAALSLPLLVAQSRAPADVLVFERPSNNWFEGPLTLVNVSPDGGSALFNRFGREVNLYSFATGREDRRTLQADLDHVQAAGFCGPNSLARLGSRGTESGIFLKKGDNLVLSSLPADAIPACSPSGIEIAYYRVSAPNSLLIGTRNGEFRGYGVSGTITAMAFSPDDEDFYETVFQQDGETSLVRINVRTSKSTTIASHLDASPIPGGIALSPDGKHVYLALVGAAPPNNEARHKPDSDRWLRIYEIDLSTRARRLVVEAHGEDNTSSAVAGGNFYWVRTVIRDSVVAVPAEGGEAKEVVAGGEIPMWHPDGKQIGYTFGGWRLADWALDLDDAVVGVDADAHRTSGPFIIVSGYHEDFPPAWSPDGHWIAFHSHRSKTAVPEYSSLTSTDDIYLRLADDVHAPEMRLTDFGWETGPAYWSPDGRKLLFTSWQRGGQPGIDKLYVLSIEPETGKAFRAEILPLPDEIRSAQRGAWSPDGQEIAIEDDRGGPDRGNSTSGEPNRALWVVRADGSHAEKILDFVGTTYDGLDWSRDGKTLIYSALAADRLQLFAVPRAGGGPRQLTHDSGNLMHPRVSPDGRWIACTRLVQSKQIWRRPLP
jgi:sugar lactone lactonase YvrE